jgi:hypothetical protein
MIDYLTSFDKLRTATETLWMILDKNGQWRAVSYFITTVLLKQ